MLFQEARLGVDFGTSSTVTVLATPDGQIRPLLFGETPVLPSAVCVGPAGTVLVGRDALHAGRVHPAAFEPNPKLRINDGSVLLGSVELPVVGLIAAVLRHVRVEAERVAGGPVRSVTLTCPATWGALRRDVLRAAAGTAGFDSVAMVAEPVAAAAYFVQTLGRQVPEGRCVVVYDFGAGTFDASVVARSGAGFTVLAEEGLSDAGGLDIDASVVAFFGATYGSRDPDGWRRLTHPSSGGDRRAARHFWDDVRTGKEMLSRAASTAVFVPHLEVDAILNREQLEHLARPLLARTVAATVATMRSAGIGSDAVAGVFLVGGSSRIPLAATMLHQKLGIAPTVLEQPELVVAGGSLLVPGGAEAGNGGHRRTTPEPAAVGRATAVTSVAGAGTTDRPALREPDHASASAAATTDVAPGREAAGAVTVPQRTGPVGDTDPGAAVTVGVRPPEAPEGVPPDAGAVGAAVGDGFRPDAGGAAGSAGTRRAVSDPEDLRENHSLVLTRLGGGLLLLSLLVRLLAMSLADDLDGLVPDTYRPYEPIFDAATLALCAVGGGWLLAAPRRARVMVAVLAGAAPWALWTWVGNIVISSRYINPTAASTTARAGIVLQVVAVLFIAGITVRATRRSGRHAASAFTVVALGGAVVPLSLVYATIYDFTSAGWAELLRSFAAAALGSVVLFMTMGSRRWAGWSAGAWIVSGGLWLLAVAIDSRAALDPEGWILPVIIGLLLAMAGAVAYRLRPADRGSAPVSPAVHELPTAPVVAALAPVVVGLLVWSFGYWDRIGGYQSYEARYDWIGFGSFPVILAAVIVLAVRRTRSGAAFVIGATAWPISVLVVRWVSGYPVTPSVSGWSATMLLMSGPLLVAPVLLARVRRTPLPRGLTALGLVCLVVLAATMFTQLADGYVVPGELAACLTFILVPLLAGWRGPGAAGAAILGAVCGGVGLLTVPAADDIDPTYLMRVAAALACTVAAALLVRHGDRRRRRPTGVPHDGARSSAAA